MVSRLGGMRMVKSFLRENTKTEKKMKSGLFGKRTRRLKREITKMMIWLTKLSSNIVILLVD